MPPADPSAPPSATGAAPDGAAPRPAPQAPARHAAPASPDAAAEALAAPLADGVLAGERRALARAVTLVESTRPDHRRAAAALLARLQPHTGRALRLGLSGTPGVGKSTFIERFGLERAEAGARVAVLAVDPSSARTGGSILGDKTRMERLSRHPAAFIRPTPSQAALGGVARRTREAILVCEAAGHDLVIVETVGVGQSETMVADMTDVFLLLLAPAGGDELQGVKRGIMELCDLVVVNKADGDLAAQARATCADYAGALRLLRRRPGDPPDFPKALAVSSVAGPSLAPVWDEIVALDRFRRDGGFRDARRRAQAARWLHAEVEDALLARFRADPAVAALWPDLERAVAAGETPPPLAAARALAAFGLREPG